MPALISILKNDRMDIEIIKSTLETLNILCSPSHKVDLAHIGRIRSRPRIHSNRDFCQGRLF